MGAEKEANISRTPQSLIPCEMHRYANVVRRLLTPSNRAVVAPLTSILMPEISKIKEAAIAFSTSGVTDLVEFMFEFLFQNFASKPFKYANFLITAVTCRNLVQDNIERLIAFRRSASTVWGEDEYIRRR